MNAFIALVRKDLVLHFSNRRAVLMSLVAPILIAAFFGSLFGGSGQGPSQIPVVLTDLDQSELSARIVANLRSDAALRVSVASADEARAQVRAGQQRAAVLLPGRLRRAGGQGPVRALASSPRWWCSTTPPRRWCWRCCAACSRSR
jgi:ABC-2 type transport system permease protein